jgi:hypothetical protein
MLIAILVAFAARFQCHHETPGGPLPMRHIDEIHDEVEPK